MIRHHLQRHKYKMVVGLPIVVLLASSLSFMRSADDVCIVPDDTRFVTVGETVHLDVIADADQPVNVIGATVTVPKDLVSITGVSRENSIIDLWSQEPTIADNDQVTFSGGIVDKNGFTGRGRVLRLTLRPTAPGNAPVRFSDVHMLAHDGTGMEVNCAHEPLVLSVRKAELPSPDVNGDDQVNVFDFGLVSARLFMSYNKTYDLNGDGKITLADLAIIISNIAASGHQESLALLATS